MSVHEDDSGDYDDDESAGNYDDMEFQIFIENLKGIRVPFMTHPSEQIDKVKCRFMKQYYSGLSVEKCNFSHNGQILHNDAWIDGSNISENCTIKMSGNFSKKEIKYY
jgi:hypothetical protein